jgi:hypothetical protein
VSAPYGRWRTLAAVLGTLVVLAAQPFAASAATKAAPTAASPGDGVGVVASSLLSSPLYVHPDMTWMFTPAAEGQIKRALRASPVRVFVVAVPFDIDDDMPDYAGYYLDRLYRRMHQAGVYLAVGPSGFITDAEYLVPRDINLPVSVEIESATTLEPAQIAADTPGRILTLLQLIATAPADPQQAVSPTPYYTPSGSGGGSSSAVTPVAVAGVLAFLFLGPLLALAGYGIARAGRGLVANRRGWGDADAPGVPAGHMPASPSTQWLRRHASGELAALGRMIAAGSDVNPGWQRACDDYDAGMLAVNSGAGQIDLVGSIVLARDGRLALDRKTAQPPPPCLVNPLHGRSVRRVTERARDVPRPAAAPQEVPMCARCARDARRGRPATLGWRLLRVEHDGKRMGYLAFDSVWRDKRFGASSPGLPQAVREHLGVS